MINRNCVGNFPFLFLIYSFSLSIIKYCGSFIIFFMTNMWWNFIIILFCRDAFWLIQRIALIALKENNPSRCVVLFIAFWYIVNFLLSIEFIRLLDWMENIELFWSLLGNIKLEPIESTHFIETFAKRFD